MSEDLWSVLLLGGSSGTGKTRLARSLAGTTGASVLQVDDLRLAAQAIATEATHPDLHAFTGPGASNTLSSGETAMQGLINIAELMESAIRVVMSHHIDVEDSGPIIIEGDGLLPWLASTEYLRNTDPWFAVVPDGAVKAAFLVEDDVDQLRSNMFGRKRGTGKEPDQDTEARERLAEGAWRYGQFLKEEAGKHSLPILQSRPFDSLLSRATEALGLT